MILNTKKVNKILNLVKEIDKISANILKKKIEEDFLEYDEETILRISKENYNNPNYGLEKYKEKNDFDKINDIFYKFDNDLYLLDNKKE